MKKSEKDIIKEQDLYMRAISGEREKEPETGRHCVGYSQETVFYCGCGRLIIE